MGDLKRGLPGHRLPPSPPSTPALLILCPLPGQPALILSPHLFHSCPGVTPEPSPHSGATGAITSSPGGPGRPAAGLGADPWLTQQDPLLTYAAENRGKRTRQHQEPLAIQRHLSIQSPPLAQPPSPTPVLSPAPALRVARSPLAAVVQQEGQPGLHQLLAHQAGAFREGQAVIVLEEEPRRAAASWVQAKVA